MGGFKKILEELGLAPKREVVANSDGTFTVTVIPPKDIGVGDGASVTLTHDQFQRYQAWLQGGLIQQLLPDLSKEDREILQSGIGPKKWDELFKEDD